MNAHGGDSYILSPCVGATVVRIGTDHGPYYALSARAYPGMGLLFCGSLGGPAARAKELFVPWSSVRSVEPRDDPEVAGGSGPGLKVEAAQ